jgi:hypothetical protein
MSFGSSLPLWLRLRVGDNLLGNNALRSFVDSESLIWFYLILRHFFSSFVATDFLVTLRTTEAVATGLV